MRAGSLGYRVTIQQQSTLRQDGQPVDVWTTVTTLWADIRVQNGLEVIKADAAFPVIKASVRIRTRSDIKSGMRVLHGATAYTILAVPPALSGMDYIDLVCEVRT